MNVIALVRDLIFSSRIMAEGRAVGVEVRVVRDAEKLRDVAGDMLLVDLNQAGAIEAAAEWRASAEGRKVIGFVSHVDAATAAAARAAGVDRVVARSQFVNELPRILLGAGK